MEKTLINSSSGIYFLSKRKDSEYSKANIIIAPIGYQGTCSCGLGTKNGPKAIIEASYHMEPFDEEALIDADELKIHTLRIQKFPDAENPKTVSHKVKKTISQILEDKKFPVLLGGEHSLSIGSIQAINEKYKDFSVLQIDAHTDLDAKKEKENRYHHAAMAVTATETTNAKFTQVGIRSCMRSHLEYAKKKNIPIFLAHNIINGKHKLKDITKTLKKDVYITIDVDAFDPFLFPLTGTPEPNGLKWQYVINLITQVSKTKNIIGLDLVEHSSKDGKGDHYSDYNAARLLFKVLAIIHKNQD